MGHGVNMIPNGLVEALTPFFCRREDGCSATAPVWEIAISQDIVSRDSNVYGQAIAITIVMVEDGFVKLDFQCNARTGTAGNPCEVSFVDNSGPTLIGLSTLQPSTSYANTNLTWIIAATAGSHTYSVWYRRSGGSGVAYVDEMVLTAIGFAE